jgi:hypothetical protein
LTRHLAITCALSAAALLAALLAGGVRKAALVGAGSASATAIASLLFMKKGASAKKPVQAAMAVMALMFLVRILVVALGTVLVARSGASVVAFVIAFFVPYFLFAAVEGAYLHALGHGPGPTA